VLFLSRSYGTSIRGEALRQKLLFIVVALLLSSGAFAALAAGEARAEEPQQPEERTQQHTLVIGGEAAKQTDIDTTVGPTPRVESLPSEPPLTQIPPLVDSTPVVPQPEPALQSKPGPSLSVSLGMEQEVKSGGENLAFEVSNEEDAFAQRSHQYDTATLPNNSELGALAPAPPRVTVVREPKGFDAVPPSLELISEHSVEDTPVALGDNGSASSQVEEALPVPSQTTPGAAPSIPLWEERSPDTTTQGMVAPEPYPPTYERQVDAQQPQVKLEPTTLVSAAQTLRSTVANVLGSFTDDSSGPATSENEDPLGDTPEPSAPLAPPVGYASLTVLAGGGQASSGGGAAPLLLLCILASGVILLRRDGRLARAFCEVPKPSSALLRPLERPG
jgi:hypothetical protein